MIRHYRWQPDTCGCVINEVHNTDTDEWSAEEIFVNPRGETLRTVRCPHHAGILDAEELYGVLHKNPDGENRRKNDARAFLLRHPAVSVGLTADNEPILPEGATFHWEFIGHGKDRVLKVRVDGIDLTPTHKREVEAVCERSFGTGKVLVQ